MINKQWIELPVVMTYFDFTEDPEVMFEEGYEPETFIENTQIQISHIISFHSHTEDQTMLMLSTTEEVLVDVPKHILEDTLNIRKRQRPKGGTKNDK